VAVRQGCAEAAEAWAGVGAAGKLGDGAVTVRQPLKRDAESGGDAGGLGEVSSSHCPRAAN